MYICVTRLNQLFVEGFVLVLLCLQLAPQFFDLGFQSPCLLLEHNLPFFALLFLFDVQINVCVCVNMCE